MANKYRGETPFKEAGDGFFLCFTIQDLVDLENTFESEFFTEIENAMVHNNTAVLMDVLKIAVKRRDNDGRAVRAFDQVDFDALNNGDWQISSSFRPLLDSIAQSWLHKTYEDLINEAVENQKKQVAEASKTIYNAVKEAAEGANIPFTEGALSDALLKLGIEPGYDPTKSGV